jgi:hypothetical protein
VAHPSTINDIMHASPIERKLIEYLFRLRTDYTVDDNSPVELAPAGPRGSLIPRASVTVIVSAIIGVGVMIPWPGVSERKMTTKEAVMITTKPTHKKTVVRKAAVEANYVKAAVGQSNTRRDGQGRGHE